MSKVGRLARGLLVFALVGLTFEIPAQAKDGDSPEWKVRGLGFFQNRNLKKQLDLVFQQRQEYFGASDVEDAALVLISTLESQGYLSAQAVATLTNAEGERETVEWDTDLDVYLSRDTRAKFVRFDMEKGLRFFFDEIALEGDTMLSESDVAAFFYSTPLLLQGERARVFTKSQLNSGVGNLRAHLNSLGYIDATVSAEITAINNDTGAVSIQVSVIDGPIHQFQGAEVELVEDAAFKGNLNLNRSLGQPYSRFMMQDIVRMLRNQYFENGYPEVQIAHQVVEDPVSDDVVNVVVELKVNPGPKVTASSVRITGAERTREGILESRRAIEDGDLFNPSRLDETRLNLSRMGVFESVTYETEQLSDHERSVTFRVQERPIWKGNVLLGWGSYEQARLGLEAERINVFGLAHRARIRTIVSLKSLLGEGRYVLPEFLGSKTAVSTKVFGLDREEVSFDRVEMGIDVAASRRIEFADVDFEAVYTFQSLEAKNVRSTESVEFDEQKAGSIEIRIGRDERDGPLNPKDGYRFFGRMEYASKFLGGEVDYQRGELGIAWHGEISRGLFWHAGLTHGVVGSISRPQKQVPYLKLFFPGGENSVRGYQRGEASPRDSEGNILGATSYALMNLELEQMLSDSLSVVLFVDYLGASARITDYPFEENLGSVGLGFRFKTFMGPIRIEYGANLDQRAFDPDGTLHFSLGYPF